MNLTAVIAEYNPFHKGHRWQLERAGALTGSTHTLALMSGSVVQRGAFALTDKWTRARAAVAGGVDLVCELPYVYAGQSAETFAAGAVKILNAIGCCRTLVFGSESGDLGALSEIAAILAEEPPAFKARLKAGLSAGLSFPRARAAAVQGMTALPAEALMREPNNILGIEYLKALIKTQSPVTPLTLKRQGAGYHATALQTPGDFASASQLRAIFKNALNPGAQALLKDQLPYPQALVTDALARQSPTRDEDFFKALTHLLLITPLKTLRELPGWEPGLEFTLKSLPETCTSLDALYNALTAKHRPKSAMARLAIALALGLSALELKTYTAPDFQPYLHVLAFNAKGQEILRAIKAAEGLPILTNLRSNQTALNASQRRCLAWDVLATDLFSLYCEKQFTRGQDYRRGPVRVI